MQSTPGLGEILREPKTGLGAVSTISFDPVLTRIMLLKTLAFIFFVWMLFYYLDSASRVKQLAVVIISCGVFQALYAAWFNLHKGMPSLVFDLPYAPRANGTFIYHNQLANYLALCLSVGVGLLSSQLSRRQSAYKSWRHRLRAVAEIILSAKVVIRLGLVLMVVAMVLTRSRMGNSAFFISLALASAYAYFFYVNKSPQLRLLIISFFIIDLIIIGSIFGVEKVKERLVETSLQSETRDEVVRDSLPIIKEHPLIGMGGGSFYSTFPSYQPEVYSGFYDHAHNDYIQFAVELGVLVALMLGAMVLFCLIAALQTMRQRKTVLYQGVAFGCVIAILHMLFHATVDFSLQSPAIGLLFLSILSLSLVVRNLLGKGARCRGT